MRLPALLALSGLTSLAALGCGPPPASSAPPPAAGEPGPAAIPPVAEDPLAERLALAQSGTGGAWATTRPPRLHGRAAALKSAFGAADEEAATTGHVIDGPRMGHDPQVAVGLDHLVVYGSHRYELFDKRTGLPLEDDGEVAPRGDFNTIFASLWQPTDGRGAPNPANINQKLRFVAGDKEICDAAAPKEGDACVQEFYDTRIMWDGHRKRYWIESAARNHLGECKPSDPCTAPKMSRTQARRYIAVAVSKTEDPRQGFHTYMLVNEYADWPKIAVNERYLVLSHRSSPLVYVFDADKLAAGNPDGGPVRLAKLDVRAYGGVKYVAPVTHDGPSGGATYLVGSSGSNELVPLALVNRDPTRAVRPEVLVGRPARVDAKLGTIEGNAVYRSGSLWLTWNHWAPEHEKEAHHIRVARVPVRVAVGPSPWLWSSDDPAHGFLQAVLGLREPAEPAEELYDYEKPALDVNARGDAVVVFNRRGVRTKSPVAPEVRYAILYGGEARPRPSVLLRRGTYVEVPDINDNRKAGIDLAHAQVDPSDDHTVWVAHAYADARVRWYRQVVAAVRPAAAP